MGSVISRCSQDRHRYFAVKYISRMQNYRQRRVAKKKVGRSEITRNPAAMDSAASFDRWRSTQLAGRIISVGVGQSARVRTRKWSVPRVKTRAFPASIRSIVDAPGRETTCGCLVTYERNAECHFRSRGAFARAAFYDLRSTKAASHREVAQCGRR